jgi:hypothetical protein
MLLYPCGCDFRAEDLWAIALDYVVGNAIVAEMGDMEVFKLNFVWCMCLGVL